MPRKTLYEYKIQGTLSGTFVFTVTAASEGEALAKAKEGTDKWEEEEWELAVDHGGGWNKKLRVMGEEE